MHTSLDGLIARPNGAIDWVKVGEEMFEYSKMQTDKSDIAIYGRITFQLMESYWPTAADKPNATKHDIDHSAWYGKVAKIIVSKSMQGMNLHNTKIISEDLPAEIIKLKKENGKDVVIFGSPSVARLLMAENLIDDYWFFVNPIILGNGIPLFKNNSDTLNLNLTETKVFSSGVVCLHYEKN